MTELMIKTYLERIGCPDARDVCRENLCRLQKAHLASVPYTNLTIRATGHEPSLAMDDLFERIITQRRGGYCFELNGLFGELLRSLGYGVTEYFARWHFGEQDPVPMRRHRVLKVFCGGEAFLADAGVGCLCPTTPLNFQFDVVQQKNERNYKLVQDAGLGIVVLTETPDGFVPYFSFTTDPHFPQDFNYVNYYCAMHPDSSFRQKFFMHRLTDELQIQILDRSEGQPERMLKIRRIADGSVETTPVADKAQLQQILKERFGIVCATEELPD